MTGRRIRAGFRRLIGIGLVLLLAAAGFAGFRMLTAQESVELEALFEATVGLYPGSDVQMLGVPVGTVTEVVPEGEVVRVTMELDPGQHAAPDTAAVIVAPTLVSDRFVQLTEPWESGAKLEPGTVIATERTAVPVEIDDLYASLSDAARTLGPEGANRNGALSDLLTVAAENLDGQGQGINAMIAEFGKATATLADVDDAFFETMSNLEGFTDMLAENDQGVAEVNRRFASVTSYLAEDRHDLAAAMDNLGSALRILDDFIRENRGELQNSVEQLIGPTKVLKKQRDSLEESVRMIPLVLQNFLRSYSAETGTLDGRSNLNDISVWVTEPEATP